MDVHRGDRLTRRAAEELLDLRPVAAAPQLAALLQAAADVAVDDAEGEARTLQLFRSQLGQRPAPDYRRRPDRRRLPTTLAKLVSVKIAVLGVLGLGASGVALAAATGSLPAPVQHAVHVLVPGAVPDQTPATSRTTSPAGGHPGQTTPAARTSIRATPASGVNTTGARPATTVAPTGSPSATPDAASIPTPGNTPTGNPGNKPSTTPGNKPTSNPGNKPTSNPGNKPTSHPGNKPSTTPGNKPSKGQGT